MRNDAAITLDVDRILPCGVGPLRYHLIGVRGTFLKEVGIAVRWPQFAGLAVIAFGLLTLSMLRFRKSLD